MTELYYSRYLKGYEGTYFKVYKKKFMLLKEYYVFNLYIGGVHKYENIIDYSSNSKEGIDEEIRIFNNFFNIIECPLYIKISDN